MKTDKKALKKTLFEREAPIRRMQPRQQRSEQTVDAIKRATLDLIAEHGYAAVSTNRIARRARVNIASLYRYFPNRQAIALAMYEDASSELAQIVHDQFLATMALPLEVGLNRLIERLVDFMDQQQITLLRLVDEVPELRDTAHAMSLENLAYQTSRVYLEQHLGKMDSDLLVCKMFFVQNLGMGLIRQYVLGKPASLGKARFVAEITELIVMYLRKPAPPC